jgi:predicted lipid-binding transport protein (Tim44 family)
MGGLIGGLIGSLIGGLVSSLVGGLVLGIRLTNRRLRLLSCLASQVLRFRLGN